MKLRKSMILLAITALFLSSAGVPADELDFNSWDTNNNELISRSEFVDQFTESYVNDWNVYDDAHLDDEDFYTVTYGIWDTDDDELLTEEEWNYGYDYYYGDYVIDDFVAVDVDGDGFVEYTEYHDALDNTEFYASWDVDNDSYLNEYELARAVFNNWDYDNSNFIELDEYTAFDTYYLDI